MNPLRNDIVPTEETRRFQMHHQLLHDVILRQAGTLGKALLESVMNAVDARATSCEISLAADSVIVQDDGIGFRSREEIEKFFEVFGQPHQTGEEKVYGTFRMGRGQMFAFGRNVWKTAHFQMEVDVKQRGLDYVLRSNTDAIQGCRIEVRLYRPLLPSELAETTREVARLVKYVAIPVRFNGRLISSDPRNEKWDVVTRDAFLRLKEAQVLSVYNLGVHVRDYPSSQLGTGGVIVSKLPLKINFARNDIQSDCPVWRRIRKEVDRCATRGNTKKATLDEGGRQRLADQLRIGELPYEEAHRLKLFTDVCGRHWSLSQLAWQYRRYHGRFSSAPKGDRMGDRIHQGKIAFVFATETLDRFEVENAEQLNGCMRGWYGRYEESFKGEWVPMAELAKDYDPRYLLVDKKDMTASERRIMQAIGNWPEQCIGTPMERKGRALLLGSSDAALGWTDGQTHIVLDRKYLVENSTSLRGWLEIGTTVLHEYCHDAPDTAEHVHGAEFYQLFHDNSPLAHDFALRAFQAMAVVLEREGKNVRKKMLRDQDLLAKAERVFAAGAAENIEASVKSKRSHS